nr:MAG TPA: hypothetical protein [Bacteriophage sp.]DAY55202.1 MAG TPA: hypothetical protein [Caudoviricetes sp.]
MESCVYLFFNPIVNRHMFSHKRGRQKTVSLSSFSEHAHPNIWYLPPSLSAFRLPYPDG